MTLDELSALIQLSPNATFDEGWVNNPLYLLSLSGGFTGRLKQEPTRVSGTDSSSLFQILEYVDASIIESKIEELKLLINSGQPYNAD